MTRPVRLLMVLLLILSILLAGSSAPTYAAPWHIKVDPWVLHTASGGETEFLLYLTTQADLDGAGSLPTKYQKGHYVYQALTSVADRSQRPVIAELKRLAVDFRPYWIANVIWVRGNLTTLQSLAGRSDITHIYANPQIVLDAPVEERAVSFLPQGIEWNIDRVNAPAVWALGYTGQGVVIGGQDTGYAWDHPAIKNQYRGWDGTTVDHDYNWFDATANPSLIPIDPYGHGTHTMGSMLGDDGGSNQIGMAPNAHWIGCRNMDAEGKGTPETYIACYQWFLAPTRLDGTQPRPDLAPDVINNSWSCPPIEGCTDPQVLLQAVQNLVAAGILTIHSAGNAGDECSSVNTPAAIYAESFTVGATDSSDAIADFSSRGPVTVDGSLRLKPDISAPGVNIRSSVPGGGYAWMSGTSMAATHVTGLVALLISAQPALRGQVDQIEAIIEATALHIPWEGCESSAVPNHAYGWGRIDVVAAIESVQRLKLEKTASVDAVFPGDIITYTLTVTHVIGVSPIINVVLTDTIPQATSFVSATSPYTQTGDTIRWDFPVLDAMGSINVQLVVRTDLTATGAIMNTDYAVRSDQVATVHGFPILTLIERRYLLPVALNNP